MTITKELLSGSTDGRSIKVASTATPGTTLHTAHATAKDEVWLWAANTDTTARKLTIEFGGTTSPDDTIEITIPPESGPVLVIPGWILSNSLVVRAFAATANVVTVNGFINRIAAA
jgi:hypothetical protein